MYICVVQSLLNNVEIFSCSSCEEVCSSNFGRFRKLVVKEQAWVALRVYKPQQNEAQTWNFDQSQARS